MSRYWKADQLCVVEFGTGLISHAVRRRCSGASPIAFEVGHAWEVSRPERISDSQWEFEVLATETFSVPGLTWLQGGLETRLAG